MQRVSPWDLVPQVFYDFIGRVMPGAVIMITGYLLVFGPDRAVKIVSRTSAKPSLLNLWSFLLLALAAYVVGIVMGQIWIITFGKIRSKSRKEAAQQCMKLGVTQYNKVKKALGKSELALNLTELPDFFIMLDHLRVCSSTESSRLLKLRAEKRLCQGLFVELGILSIVNIYFMYGFSEEFFTARVVLEIFMIITMFCCWTWMVRLERYFMTGTCLAWLFYNFKNSTKQHIHSE